MIFFLTKETFEITEFGYNLSSKLIFSTKYNPEVTLYYPEICN